MEGRRGRLLLGGVLGSVREGLSRQHQRVPSSRSSKYLALNASGQPHTLIPALFPSASQSPTHPQMSLSTNWGNERTSAISGLD